MLDARIHPQSPWVEYLAREKRLLHDATERKAAGQKLKTPLLVRFLRKIKVSTSGCWEWIGATNRNKSDERCWKWPYGVFGIWNGKINRIHYAHRLSFELFNGPIAPGLVIRHSCHNTICVNPEHLIAGTSKENTHDSVKAGRIANGERCPGAKLSSDGIIEMRTRYQQGELVSKIAEAFGISISQTADIVSNRAWKHVV